MKKLLATGLAMFSLAASAADACVPCYVVKVVKKNITVAQSWDPNEMKGPVGIGEQRYVKPGEPMDYTIYFENETNATAAAIKIAVTLPKDVNLDWSTLELGEVVFGEHTDDGFVKDKSARSSTYPLAGTGCEVRTTVTESDDAVTWNLRIWDPNTTDHFPDDFNMGILPPNDPETHCGEGHITYRVKVKDDAAQGAVVRASASIVFDDNPAIETDPAWWNTVGSPGAQFAADEVVVDEGGNAEIRVSGGDAEKASSVKVYLTYNTAAAADVDLKTGTVADGDAAVSSKPPYQTNLKFPLMLSWAAGEVGEKVITIPVKADKAVEDDEFFTLQLADAQGMELGDGRVCTVTIHDPGYDDLAAKVAAGTATAAELKAWDKLQKAKAPYIRGLADSAERGKVSGSGLCAAGKKVTLKASANKGFVFLGWRQGSGKLKVESGELSEEAFVAKTASLVVDRTGKPAKDSATSTTITGVDGDATYYAVFITADEDKGSIKLKVDGVEMRRVEDNAPYRTNVWAGVYLEWPVAASALSAATVKVAGLPSGLKFAAKPVTGKVGSGKAAVVITNVPANTIYGAPTAASKADRNGAVKPSEVKVTVTTAGKSSQTYQIDTTVVALPMWSQGTFAGCGHAGRVTLPSGGFIETALPCGTVSLTVSAAGKVSGKAQGDGVAYTLAAPYYSGFDIIPGDDGLVSNFMADVTASWSYKEGGKTIKTNDVVQLTVRDNGVGGFIETALPGDHDGQELAALPNWTAWQYNWKAEPWKTLGKKFDKKEMAYAILYDGTFSENEEAVAAPLGKEVVGRVTLKFKANGTASVSGEFVSDYDEKTKKYKTVKASGSATLVPVSEDNVSVFVYLAPKGLAPHARALVVPCPEE